MPQQAALRDADLLGAQALLGERVTVLAVQDGWAQVEIPSQSPPTWSSWMPMHCLIAAAPLVTARVATATAPTAWLRADDESPPLEISFGTILPTIDRDGATVRVSLPDGRTALIRALDVAVRAMGATPLASRSQVVAWARQFLGLRYLWGGTSGFGFDCSGLVHLVYRTAGIALPRTARLQARCGIAIPLASALAGDLVFFANASGIHHVAICVGEGDVLSAPSIGLPVRLAHLADLLGGPDALTARQVLPPASVRRPRPAADVPEEQALMVQRPGPAT